MSEPFLGPTLEQLAAAAQKDDPAAFRCLVERTQSKAFGLSFRLLADEHDARDAAQESFIRLWENLRYYDPEKPFETWFYRVVTNVALDHLRARKRLWRIFQRNDALSALVQDGSDTEKAVSNTELAKFLKVLTHELPIKQRMVVVLRDFQNLSTDEVAEVTRMSVESVKTNLHYARTRLRRLMKERFDISREAL